MNCIINKSVLVGVVHALSGVVNPKSTFSVLSGILLELKKGKAFFTGTDLEITTTITITPQEIKEEGKTVIPFREFFSIIKEFPSEEIELLVEQNIIFLKSPQFECKLNCYKPEDFPKISPIKDKQAIIIEAEKLKDLLEKTAFCVYRDEGNYVLSGVLFEIEGDKIKAVATDGKRLAVAEAAIREGQLASKDKKQFILPSKSVSEITKTLGTEDGYLMVDKNQVGFETGDIQLISGIIEGEFPEYSQYIPEPAKNSLTIARNTLFSMLKRASVLTTPEYQAVYFHLSKERFSITKTTPQVGEIKEETKEFAYKGEPMVISFNPLYILELLKVLPDEDVCIEIFSPDKPAVIRKQGYTYLVLPVKIS